MELNVIAYLALLLAVAALRLYELRISRRHQSQMVARGASKIVDPRFRWMVLLHAAVLLGSALEVVLLHRPFYPVFAAVCFAIFLAANGVRWWVIRSLGDHWNVLVIDSTGMMELVALLDRDFNINISDDELIPENLDSIASICAFLHRKGIES